MYYENYTTQKDAHQYEYATVNTTYQFVPLYEEYYYSAGWSQAIKESSRTNPTSKDTPVTLNFRRSRHWAHNIELMKLQDICENIISTIIELRNRKYLGPTLAAIASGVIGGPLLALTISYVVELIKGGPAIFVIFPIMLSAATITYLSVVPTTVYKKLYGKSSKRIAPLLHEEYSKFDYCCQEIRAIVNPGMDEPRG